MMHLALYGPITSLDVECSIVRELILYGHESLEALLLQVFSCFFSLAVSFP